MPYFLENIVTTMLKYLPKNTYLNGPAFTNPPPLFNGLAISGGFFAASLNSLYYVTILIHLYLSAKLFLYHILLTFKIQFSTKNRARNSVHNITEWNRTYNHFFGKDLLIEEIKDMRRHMTRHVLNI